MDRHFEELTPRMRGFRDELLRAGPQVCVERALITARVYRESRDQPLDARIHPEDHRDLIVRVAGCSAFFNVLSRKTRDDIIARTEQTL